MTTPMEISARQNIFFRSIIDPDERADSKLLEGLVAAGTLDASGAVSVYRSGYYARLTDQLGETFEAVWWVLGDETFFALCRTFIVGHCSRSYNLSDYGHSFPEFLADCVQAQEFPFLVELARFELKFAALFHTREHSHLDAQALASLPDPAATKFVFGDASLLARHDYPVSKVWQWRKRSQDEVGALPEARSERVLMYKKDGEIFLNDLDEGAYAVLSLLASGQALGETLDSICVDSPGFGSSEVSGLFELIARTGIITTVIN